MGRRSGGTEQTLERAARTRRAKRRKPPPVGPPHPFAASPAAGHPQPTPTPAPLPGSEERYDLARIQDYAPTDLIGRSAELDTLTTAWNAATGGQSKKPNVLTFVALGGEGKTSLVARWAVDLEIAGWPACEACFAWSFYSQGTREQIAASSDLFLKEALTFFGDPEMAGSPRSAFDKGKRLAQLVGEMRALLILDGLEPLQYAPTAPTRGELKDQGVAALLKALAASNRGLCVVTTRYSIPDLKAYRKAGAPEHELKRLSTDAGVDLLTKLGVNGSQNVLETLVEDVKGHALTLNLLGTYLRDAHSGDVRKRDLVQLNDADEELGGHAFRVMDAYVEWFETEGEKGKRAVAVLRLLGLFDRPATANCLAALWGGSAIPGLTESLVGLSEAQRNVIFTRLETAKLLAVNRDTAHALVSLDAHPLLREYFTLQLRLQYPDAWRAAHRRVYEYLCETKEGDQPTLEDLQPLYQAIIHGCQAGMHQEACDKVYYARIRQSGEDYTKKKLGAFGADLETAACFFEQPWSRVSPVLKETDQAWLLNDVAFCLRALGRLTEAIEPMRAGLKMRVKQNDWANTSIVASNLSELKLTLGEMAEAVQHAERAVTYAEKAGPLYQINNHTTQAYAIYQLGNQSEAEELFLKAEAMQTSNEPNYPSLYALPGFRYCDLLLASSERAAWHHTLMSSDTLKPSSLTDSYRAVSTRATQTLQWATQNNLSILTIALDHLTLGRAALFHAILKGNPLDKSHAHLQDAVNGLRRASQSDYLLRGLFARAWLRYRAGTRTGSESAQSDLNEAWEIAERGPMRLHMVDIHLHRARLFGRETHYPWESPRADLAAARKLIEKCGYWRRKEELEDAERALLPGAEN